MLARSGQAGRWYCRTRRSRPSRSPRRCWRAWRRARFLVLRHPEVARVLPDAGRRPRRVAARMNRMRRRIEEVERGYAMKAWQVRGWASRAMC